MDAHVVALIRARFRHENGVLYWRFNPAMPKQWNVRFSDRPAGTLHHDGYVQVRLAGRNHAAHRIIWALVHGELAQLEIDHINGDRIDNRPENLRLATRGENRRNSRARGLWPKGVHRNRHGSFVAQIKLGGVNTYLGSFDKPEDAHERYAFAADLYYGEFACTTR